MIDLAQLAAVPGVRGAVLADLAGGFLDAVREPEGEALAAVAGFLCTTVGQAGDDLGLGPVARISVAGAARAGLVVVDGQRIVAATIEPGSALAGVERSLDASRKGSA